MIYAVLTGDISNSRKLSPQLWLDILKASFSPLGPSPQYWQVYRGDSFQALLPAENALDLAFLLRARIKSHKGLDLKLAIGLGEVSFFAEKITESNGTAFIHSGERFERLKKQKMGIQSGYAAFDHTFEVLLQLSDFISSSWTAKSAELMSTALQYPHYNQHQLAQALNKSSQSTISAGLKRSGYDEILQVIHLYKSQLASL